MALPTQWALPIDAAKKAGTTVSRPGMARVLSWHMPKPATGRGARPAPG